MQENVELGSKLPPNSLIFLNQMLKETQKYLFSHFRHFISFSVESGGCSYQEKKWPLTLEGQDDLKM